MFKGTFKGQKSAEPIQYQRPEEKKMNILKSKKGKVPVKKNDAQHGEENSRKLEAHDNAEKTITQREKQTHRESNALLSKSMMK